MSAACRTSRGCISPRAAPATSLIGTPACAGTGPLPTTIDFPLTRQEESARFEALLFADTQPANGTELGYLRDDIVAGALGMRAAFGINHGDVVFDDLSLYPRYLQILSATGIPWHHCPGNHDINSEARDDRGSRETWKRVFGPRHYAFQHAGATFIMLDNVHYFGHNPGAPRSGTLCRPDRRAAAAVRAQCASACAARASRGRCRCIFRSRPTRTPRVRRTTPPIATRCYGCCQRDRTRSASPGTCT